LLSDNVTEFSAKPQQFKTGQGVVVRYVIAIKGRYTLGRS